MRLTKMTQVSGLFEREEEAQFKQIRHSGEYDGENSIKESR